MNDATSDAEELDVYMGFSKGIIGLFGRISRLSRTNVDAEVLEAYAM